MADRGGIEALLHLLEEAFRGPGIEESNESQALLTNLATVPETSWRALPPRASRSIEAIAVHVGACKVMYADHAFGSGSLEFGTPAVSRGPRAPRRASSSSRGSSRPMTPLPVTWPPSRTTRSSTAHGTRTGASTARPAGSWPR